MSTDSTIKATAKEKIKGWIKMAIGTAGGLLSGAIVMYVTPLVDKVVRPSKPLANFSHEKDGLKIRFQNLSSGVKVGGSLVMALLWSLFLQIASL